MERLRQIESKLRAMQRLHDSRGLTDDEQDEYKYWDAKRGSAIDRVLAERATEQARAPVAYRVYHLTQRLKATADVKNALFWAERLLSLQDVSSSSRCYLEQSGSDEQTMGQGMHIHMIAFFAGPKSVLLQRVCQKHIAPPNMTDVRRHDNVFALQAYLDGGKAADKTRKVETDILWRKQNNLKLFYTHDSFGRP